MIEPGKPKLPSGRPRKKAHGNGATWLALFVVLSGVAGFLALLQMVMPGVVGIFAVVIGSVLFFAFHYLTWGRWLMNRRRPVDDDE